MSNLGLLDDAIDTVRFLTDDSRKLSKKERKGAINLLNALLILEQAKDDESRQNAYGQAKKCIADYPVKNDTTLRIYTDVTRYAKLREIPEERPKMKTQRSEPSTCRRKISRTSRPFPTYSRQKLTV